MRYRKLPVTIDAHQWDGTNRGATPIINWILRDGGTARYHPGNPDYIAIDTLEGTMMATPNDWVIKGVQGEFYACKPEIFAATYEAVEE